MSDFDFDLNDDFQMSEENYPERQTGPKPPTPGNYVVKSGKWAFRTKRDGTMQLWREKYPVIGISTVEITDPQDSARKVVVFQDVPTMPIERDGKLASEAADLLRSFDRTATASSTNDVIKQVTERLTAGEEFVARLDYKAYDPAYAKQLVADVDPKDRKAVNAAYRKAEVRGYRNIQKQNIANGKPDLPITKWISPAGNIVDVQPYISVYYPQGENVTLGPDKGLIAR